MGLSRPTQPIVQHKPGYCGLNYTLSETHVFILCWEDPVSSSLSSSFLPFFLVLRIRISLAFPPPPAFTLPLPSGKHSYTEITYVGLSDHQTIWTNVFSYQWPFSCVQLLSSPFWMVQNCQSTWTPASDHLQWSGTLDCSLLPEERKNMLEDMLFSFGTRTTKRYTSDDSGHGGRRKDSSSSSQKLFHDFNPGMNMHTSQSQNLKKLLHLRR